MIYSIFEPIHLFEIVPPQVGVFRVYFYVLLKLLSLSLVQVLIEIVLPETIELNGCRGYD